MTDADMIRQGLREADAGDLTGWDAVKAELEEWARKRNESDERKVNAELIRRARRNPPPAEWCDSPEEECPSEPGGDG